MNGPFFPINATQKATKATHLLRQDQAAEAAVAAAAVVQGQGRCSLLPALPGQT